MGIQNMVSTAEHQAVHRPGEGAQYQATNRRGKRTLRHATTVGAAPQ